MKQEFPLWLSRLRTQLVFMRMQVQSLALLSGLRIWCCHSCSLGCSCDLDQIPGPGTPHATWQPKKEKNKIKKIKCIKMLAQRLSLSLISQTLKE